MEKIEDAIQEYHDKIKLVSADIDIDKIDSILSMKHNDILLLTDKDRSVYCFELAKFTYMLRKEENRVKSLLDWSTSFLSELAVRDAHKYCDPKFTKMEEKILLFSVNNDAGKSLMKKNREMTLYLQSISDLWKSVEFMTKTLQGVNYGKTG